MKWYQVANVKTITLTCRIRILKWILPAAVGGGTVGSRGLALGVASRSQPIRRGSRVGGAWHRSKTNKAGLSSVLNSKLGLHTVLLGHACLRTHVNPACLKQRQEDYELQTSLAIEWDLEVKYGRAEDLVQWSVLGSLSRSLALLGDMQYAPLAPGQQPAGVDKA